MKKGRHRRYEETRKFQRQNADSSIEDIDLDAPDPWALPVTEDEEPDEDDQYAALAEKYNDDEDDEDDEDDWTKEAEEGSGSGS